MKNLSEQEDGALRRLIAEAKRGSEQGRRAADFLLAWWNPGQCGGFDFTSTWRCDESIAGDMVTMFALITKYKDYPAPDYQEDFTEIVRRWRPELL